MHGKSSTEKKEWNRLDNDHTTEETVYKSSQV